MKRLILLLFLASVANAKEFSYRMEPPHIPAAKIEAPEPPQVNTFCAANLSCTITGAWGFTTPLTSLSVGGTATLTGTTIVANLDGIVRIGGLTPQIGASSDIGAQINAAYAAAPSSGQKAYVLPQNGGGCYSSSVPIVLATQGKYFPIEGPYLGNQTGLIAQGTCINFTPTATLATTAAAVASNVATLTMTSNPITFGFLPGEAMIVTGFTGGDTYFNGTFSISTVTSTQITFALTHANASAATNGAAAHTALTLDYTVVQGGGSTPHTSLRNIIITNNGCNNTVGGCGSSSGGANFGPNAGTFAGKWENVSIRGFNVGLSVSNTIVGNITWSMLFENVWVTANSTGMALSNLATSEAMKWKGGGFLNNATGFSCGASITTDLTFDTTSFDVNSTVGISNSGCRITLIAPHFENSNFAGNPLYISQSIGMMSILGGRAMEDNASGGPTPQLFTFTGGSWDIEGLESNCGRTVTNLINNTGGGSGSVTWYTESPTLCAPDASGLPQTCSVAYRCVVTRMPSTGVTTQKVVIPTLQMPFNGAGSPDGTASTGVEYFNGTLNRTQLLDNGVAHDDVNGTRNILTAASTDTVTNKSFGPGGLVPATAGATDVGSAALPFGSMWLGTAATNNFRFQAPATAAARVISFTDPLGAANLPFTNNTSTTTTQVVHATATAGLYTTSAIASADINAALTTPGPIGGTTPNTGKFTSMTATTLLWSTTAPTIAGAGCGGSAASIPTANGTAAFKINVGTAPLTACTITMPAATTGWNCFATDITTNSTTQMIVKQTGAESTTSVTLTNFSDVAAASNFTANDILKVACFAD